MEVCLNPLVMLLAATEKKNGRPLTREEVLAVRDKAAHIVMSREEARKFYEAMDGQMQVPRIGPDRVWEEWQEIRERVEWE